jgi:peroxiredoxin
VLDVAVSFEKKAATVRYLPDKVQLDQILKQYDSTPFSVTLDGFVASVHQRDGAIVRTWFVRTAAADKATKQEASPELIDLFVELTPADGDQIVSLREVTLSDVASQKLKFHGDMREAELTASETPAAKGRRRFVRQVEPIAPLDAGEITVPVAIQAVIKRGDNTEQAIESQIAAVIRIPQREQSQPANVAGGPVALVGGSLQLALGHLCEQKGCVEHFHESLSDISGLAAVRPFPSADSPRANVYVRTGQPIDVWNLREQLRNRGVGISGIVPRDMPPFVLRVELPRWVTDEKAIDAQQCLVCRQRLLDTIQSFPWARGAEIIGGGVNVRPAKADADLVELLDAVTKTGICPSAVWLVPDGTPMPKAATPRVARRGGNAKSGGSEVHPVIEFDFGHVCDVGTEVLSLLANEKWLSRSQLLSDETGMKLRTSIGDRQFAALSPLLEQFRTAGHQPRQIRLSDFGEVRIQLTFAHICGEVEYSKPPKQDPNKKDTKPESEKKPFVPQPLRPAETSNGRKAIEAAVDSVPWIKQAVYQEYHTQREFNGPAKMMLALTAPGDDVVRLDELTDSLRRAGFPPTSVTVSRLFPGIPFAKLLPGELELTGRDGNMRLLSSFRQPDRPFVVVFVNVNCPLWEKYKYTADAKNFQHLSETIAKLQDRAAFVAVSANPDDKFAEVTELLDKAGLKLPVLHDAAGSVRAVFNAQVVTPPPHVFVFDADGRLRYAGEPHNNWDKLDQPKRDYLDEAIQHALAGEYQVNGAVFFNRSKCNCSDPNCKCPKCGCGATCRCGIGH